MANDVFKELADRIAALEKSSEVSTEKAAAYEKAIAELREQVEGKDGLVADEVPIRHFNGDRRFFKWERNGSHLTLLFNEDAATQNGGAGGGPPLPPGFSWLVGQVTAATATAVVDANGNPCQWSYTIQQMKKTISGYNGWDPDPDGYIGAAYNLLENGNTGIGRQMNGVDHDGADYPATWAMQSVQPNCLVVFFVVTVGATTEAWFTPIPNGEDGLCGSGS